MLENTFVHIPGIGPKTEQGIWSRGLLTWDDFLRSNLRLFTEERDRFIRGELASSLSHREDLDFFWQRLPPNEKWRVFGAFRHRAVYLDIETSGGFQGCDEITLIGIYDGREVRTFINGSSLDAFEDALAPDTLLITYNGTGFDLPFIRRWFRHLALPRPISTCVICCTGWAIGEGSRPLKNNWVSPGTRIWTDWTGMTRCCSGRPFSGGTNLRCSG